MNRISIFLVKFYQLTVSPVFAALGCGCRFHPSCSEYAVASFEKNGFFEALALSAKRVVKCGPWNLGGVDLPVSKIKGAI